MKKLMAWAWLAVALSVPAYAQDESPAAADVPPAETIAEDAVVIDDGSGSAEERAEAEAAEITEPAPAEDVAVVEAAYDDSGDDGDVDQDEGLGLNLYVGVEYDQTTVDVNDEGIRQELSGRRFDSDFYKLRLGIRMFEAIGLEVQAGFPANDSSRDELETKQFYGIYFVPTGVLLNTVEVSARLGYAYTELESEDGSKDADGASFGIAFELPLRLFGEGMPNLRLGAGGTVYQEDRDARVFGWHGGLRYDFTL